MQIPKDSVSGITSLVDLSEESIEELAVALNSAPKVSDSDEMSEHIAPQVPSISAAQLGKIVETMYGLYHVREFSGVAPAQFLNDTLEAITESPDIAPALTEPQLLLLRSRLSRLLKIETLLVIAKATLLQRDGERLYCESKVLSDIRPVFGEDPSAKPAGAVITHTLKIAYHERGKHRDFHLVLDSIDLKSLKEAIDRALTKDEALRKFLKDSDWPELGL